MKTLINLIPLFDGFLFKMCRVDIFADFILTWLESSIDSPTC